MEGSSESSLRSGRMCPHAAAGQSRHWRGSGGQLGHVRRAGRGGLYCFPVLLSGQDICGGEEADEGDEDSGAVLRVIPIGAHLRKCLVTQGLVLYSAVYITPSGSDCWIDKPGLSLKGSPLIVRYIYAVYWAMTTIITVGYGDITPQNYAEVLVVMVVEICGTSFFGYMISVIGGIVDKKNQKNEEYDNYQETITKLRDHYSLSAELCQKMKGDIKDKYNKQKATPLKKVEES